MKLTNRLAQIMDERNLTEERLSTMTGIRQNSINPIKNSKQIPRIDTALRIARAVRKRVDRIWSLS